MSSRVLIALTVAVATVSLVGCWDSHPLVVHKQGEYKGKTDPLLKQQASARAESLRKRFQLVQVDR